MLHVEVSRITADPHRLADAVRYLTGATGEYRLVFSSARPA